MPSKGNNVIKCRVTQDVEKEVEITINRRNLFSDNEPWDTSAFIRQAIREKIAHMERSRKRRSSKKKGPSMETPTVQTMVHDVKMRCIEVTNAISHYRQLLENLKLLVEDASQSEALEGVIRAMEWTESGKGPTFLLLQAIEETHRNCQNDQAQQQR